MKKILPLALVLLFLASCGTARKIQQDKKETQVDSTATAKDALHKSERVIDTTRTEYGKITITEVEFYPPFPTVKPEQPADKRNRYAKAFQKADSLFDAEHRKPNYRLPNAGHVQGAIKRVKQTQIETGVEEKGESKESEESKEREQATSLARNEETKQMQQEPAPDPYRWRYFFYISLIAVAVLLYLKRVPILNWIKKILSGVRKIF